MFNGNTHTREACQQEGFAIFSRGRQILGTSVVLGNLRLKILCFQLSHAPSRALWTALPQRNRVVTAAPTWRSRV